MRPLNRRGFTLLELLVVVTLLAVAGTMIVAICAIAARAMTRALSELVAVRTSAATSALLRSELRDAVASDVTVIDPATITIPRKVSEAFACRSTSASADVSSRRSDIRAPAAGDRVFLLVGVLPGAWTSRTVTSVVPLTCPDGRSGFRLGFAPVTNPPTYVRLFDPVRMSRYTSGGRAWLGIAPADLSSPVQPFAGPVSAAGTSWASAGTGLEMMLQPLSMPQHQLYFGLMPP